MAFKHAPLRALDDIDFVGSLDRIGGLRAVALLAVSLQELVHQRLAQSVQLPFQLARTHLLGFARCEEGFGVKRHSKLTPWRHRKLTPEETAYVDGSAGSEGLSADGGFRAGRRVSHAGPGYPRETERPAGPDGVVDDDEPKRAFRRATTRVPRKARLAHAATGGPVGVSGCARRAWRRRHRARGPRPDER